MSDHLLKKHPSVDIITPESFIPILRAYIRDLSQAIDLATNNSLEIYLEKCHYKLNDCDVIRTVLENDTNNKTQLIFRNILLANIFQTQKITGLGGYVSTRIAISVLETLLSAHQINVVQNILSDKSYEKLIRNISRKSRRGCLDDVRMIHKLMNNNPVIQELLMYACKNVGSSGKLIIDAQSNTRTHLEVTTGAHFKCTVVSDFWKSQKSRVWEYKDTLCIMIDGIIESVSEIHHLLQYLNENKHPAVLFARGFSEEVVATLVVNATRGTLNIAPVIIPYDMTHCNTLNDVAVICGGDIISSIKGDLISMIDPRDITPVESLRITPDEFVIVNEKTATNVQVHISNLLNHKDEIKVSNYESYEIMKEKSRLLDNRINAMSHRCVILSLGPEYSHVRDVMKDQIEVMMSTLHDISRHGIIGCDDIITNLSLTQQSPMICGLRKAFTKINQKYNCLPARGVLLAIQNGVMCAQQMVSTGALVAFN